MALKIVEQTGVNLFLTGKAGTGKTTFLRNLCETTHKRHVVLAPTGVAAINAGGQTIHSFFQFSFSPYIPGRGFADEGKKFNLTSKKIKLIRSLDLIVIDEISMVRPDLLDAIDDILRRLRHPLKPFGGVQLLLIGDLRQLAPVAVESEWAFLKEYYSSPYFFESRALKQAGYLMVELSHVYRQSDPEFLGILNGIRDAKADLETLAKLNRRADRSLFPADTDAAGYIRLTSHNYRADAINRDRLAALTTPPHVFTAQITGKFPESSYPADKELELKEGAKVMFIKNDNLEHRYYNGLIGRVISLSENEIKVLPDIPGAAPIPVGAVAWDNTKYSIDSEGKIKEEVEGSFVQVPLRHAWAITIHKSQGLTFDRAIVDAAHSFAPGQTYVALSRCRTLEGLLLESPLTTSAIMTDPAVNVFIGTQPRMQGSDEELKIFRDSYFAETLHELFDFRTLADVFETFFRAAVAAYSSTFPKFMDRIYELRSMMEGEVRDVCSKLFVLFGRVLPKRGEAETDRLLDQKIRGGANYFALRLEKMLALIADAPTEIDNEATKKRLVSHQRELMDTLEIKIALLKAFSETAFDPQTYLKVKTDAVVKSGNFKSVKTRAGGGRTRVSRSGAQTAAASSGLDDIENKRLYEFLKQWRMRRANGAPAFTILSNKVLIGIANRAPRTLDQLREVGGMGPVKMSQFGEDIIEVVNSCLG